MKKLLNFVTDNFYTFLVYGLIGWLYEVSWYLIVEHRFVNRGVLFGPVLPIYGFGMLLLLLLLHKFISKKHLSNNIFINSVSIFVIITFIVTTIIEYTTTKIYNVMYFLGHYGLLLLIINIIGIIVCNILVKKIKCLQKIDMTIVIVFLLIWLITTLLEYVSHYAIDKISHKMLWDYTYDFLNINSRVNWDASRNFAIGGTFLLYVVQPIINKVLRKFNNKYKYIIGGILFILIIIDFIL